MDDAELLKPDEVDVLLRLEDGQAVRLARRGALAAIFLNGGKIVRFRRSDIERLLVPVTKSAPRRAAQ